MNDLPEKEALQPAPAPAARAGDAIGRVLFLVAGGLLLATLVSCACNPVR
jgi:hypothetical protein